MIAYLSFVALGAAGLYFHARRLKVYLLIFQQETYAPRRFLGLIRRRRLFDWRLSLTLSITILLGSRIYTRPDEALALISALFFFGFALTHADPERIAKKPLVMTPRARRLFWVSMAIVSVPHLLLAWNLGYGAFAHLWLVFLVQANPISLLIATALLWPYEERARRYFLADAKACLSRASPLVIGITGSFGKTSTKMILGHILDSDAPTLVTPGSVNTPMGISRILREKLAHRHTYLVVEMGAYAPGSIQRLCDLTPPSLGIITAIGAAHYERFKSLERVGVAKFELAESVAREGGVTYMPAGLQSEAARSFLARSGDKAKCVDLSAGERPPSDGLALGTVGQSRDGLALSLWEEGHRHEMKVGLYGAHQAENVALAVFAARGAGLSMERIRIALRTMPQIAHRLEVKPQDGWTLIDDAYNGNPRGFREGFDLLDLFVEGEGRRIVITPGLAEMGDLHGPAHESLGAYGAGRIDLLLVVNPDRIPELTTGFLRASEPFPSAQRGEVKSFSTFAQAYRWLLPNLRKGDVVLLANDLPDIYETTLRL